MAELADAPDLGSGGRPCRFKSCHPHYKGDAVRHPLCSARTGLYLTLFLSNIYVDKRRCKTYTNLACVNMPSFLMQSRIVDY